MSDIGGKFDPLRKVPGTGLEPAHHKTPEPKSGASTNSATPATHVSCSLFLKAASAEVKVRDDELLREGRSLL